MRWILGVVLLAAGALVLSLITLGPGGGPLLRPADLADPATAAAKLRARFGDAPVKVYKWRDAAGRWHYDERPPPAGTPYEIIEVDPKANLLPAVDGEKSAR